MYLEVKDFKKSYGKVLSDDNYYLSLKDLKKSYGEGGSYVEVLKGVSVGVEKGEMCVIQ